jgi:hypothetical protein
VPFDSFASLSRSWQAIQNDETLKMNEFGMITIKAAQFVTPVHLLLLENLTIQTPQPTPAFQPSPKAAADADDHPSCGLDHYPQVDTHSGAERG